MSDRYTDLLGGGHGDGTLKVQGAGRLRVTDPQEKDDLWNGVKATGATIEWYHGGAWHKRGEMVYEQKAVDAARSADQAKLIALEAETATLRQENKALKGSGATVQQIIGLLKATGNRPRVHGNGFIQLDITKAIRLHVWGDGRIPKQRAETPIHNHTFGFTSYVLIGAIEQVESEATDDPAGFFQPHQATVRHGEDTVLTPIGGRVEIRLKSQRVISAGQTYSMRPFEIHESRPLGPSLSVIVKDGPSLAQGGYSPTIYVPVGTTPDNDFDRYAEPSDGLWQIIEDVINLHPAEQEAAASALARLTTASIRTSPRAARRRPAPNGPPPRTAVAPDADTMRSQSFEADPRGSRTAASRVPQRRAP